MAEIKTKVKQAPLGVKIIAVLYYISSIVLLLSAIGIFVKGASIGNAIAEGLGPLGGLISGLATFLGIILLLFSILEFFIGRGLWKLQNWARILVVIFLVIGALISAFSLFGGAILQGIISLILSGVLLWYLLFKKEVKEAFAK